MSQREVEHAIRNVQKHILDFQPDPPRGPINYDAPANNHETSTRYIIIDPILRALGWDLSDPLDCVVDRRVEIRSKRRCFGYPDYVLLGSPFGTHTGEPVIVVEAKRINVPSYDDLGLDQMDDYLEALPSAQVAVVTNGQYWEIGHQVFGGWECESEPDKALGLHWDNVAETARRLRKYLDKEIYRGSSFRGGRGGF